jgi:hypothetical protein
MSMFDTFGRMTYTPGRKENTLRKLRRLHAAARAVGKDRLAVAQESRKRD